jgi:hypothetical protein
MIQEPCYKSFTKTGSETKRATCRNLKVISNDAYTIVKGSLPKFVHGGNVETLPFNEILFTIQELSECLDRDISTAQILGVDWSTTINTQTKPTVYYSILGETYPFQRLPYKNSLYYNSSDRKLMFYDKGKEAGMVGNWLRNELQLMKLNKFGLTFHDLTKPQVFNSFTTQWLQVYQSINKLREPLLTPFLKNKILVNFF